MILRGYFSRIRTAVIVNLTHLDPILFLDDCRQVFLKRIGKIIEQHKALKVNATFCGEFSKLRSNEEITDIKYLNTKNAAIFPDTALAAWYDENIKGPILRDFEDFQEGESGWALKSIINLEIGKFYSIA